MVKYQIVSGQNDKTNNHVDLFDQSVIAKQHLPLFARFQFGDPAVEGFSGETMEEKNKRMQWWSNAKY